MIEIKKSQIVKVLENSNGSIFSVVFTKKDGSDRKLTGRLGVSKGVTGVGLKFDPKSKGLLPVFDMQKEAYRMVNIETVKGVQVNGKFYVVVS